MMVEAEETTTVVVETPGKDKTKTVRKFKEAAKRSWAQPETAKKRNTTHAVRVNGELYRSVREAFKQLRLPDRKHQSFRLELKKSEGGKLTFEHNGEKFKFTLSAEHIKGTGTKSKDRKATPTEPEAQTAEQDVKTEEPTAAEVEAAVQKSKAKRGHVVKRVKAETLTIEQAMERVESKAE